MKLKLTQEQERALRAFLDGCEDAEKLSEREYVADLYDIERPITLDLVFSGGAVSIDGAAELKYDEAADGWYMGEPLKSVDDVVAALSACGAWKA